MFQLYLRHDPALRRPNTFFFIPEIETIRCRIKLGAAPEVSPVDVHLRFRSGKYPGLVFVHQIDETTFQTEMAKLHDDLPKMELMLMDVPAPVANAIRNL